PESVNVPAPVLVSANGAPPSLMMPLKVVEVLSPPVVSVTAAAPVLLFTSASPASEPMVWLKPLRLTKVSPDPATVNALAAENTLGPPATRKSSWTVVGPEYVEGPERIRTPRPALVSPPEPEIGPESVVWPAKKATIVAVPFRTIALPIVRLVTAARSVVPSAKVTVPALSAELFPTTTSPALMVVPPP